MNPKLDFINLEIDAMKKIIETTNSMIQTIRENCKQEIEQLKSDHKAFIRNKDNIIIKKDKEIENLKKQLRRKDRKWRLFYK